MRDLPEMHLVEGENVIRILSKKKWSICLHGTGWDGRGADDVTEYIVIDRRRPSIKKLFVLGNIANQISNWEGKSSWPDITEFDLSICRGQNYSNPIYIVCANPPETAIRTRSIIDKNL